MSYGTPPHGYPSRMESDHGYQPNSGDPYHNPSPYPQASYQGSVNQGYYPPAPVHAQGSYQAGFNQASNYQGYPPPPPDRAQASYPGSYPANGPQASGYHQQPGGYPPPNALQASAAGSSYPPGLSYPPPRGSTTSGAAAVVVGAQYCLPHAASFAVVKHALSLSDGDWSITDAAGNRVFKVSGRAFGIRDKRYLLDAAGNKILRMQQKILTLHDTWYVYHGDSEHLICSVKKSALVQLTPSIDIFLASNSTESVPDFKLVGNYLERDMMVYFGQQPIAQMTREMSYMTMAAGNDTFGVTVFPGGDYAFVFALVVIMDAVYLHKDGDSER